MNKDYTHHMTTCASAWGAYGGGRALGAESSLQVRELAGATPDVQSSAAEVAHFATYALT